MVWLSAIGGLVILLIAGDSLVKGAVNLALRIGIPALIVSLTIVALGTSAPELLIAIKAALDGVPALAMGNVVGSNISNVLLVLGVPALIAVMHTSQMKVRKSYLQMIAATLLFIALAWRGQFDMISGLVLLTVLGYILADAILESLRHSKEKSVTLEEADAHMPAWKISLFLLGGLIGLPLGADMLVDSAVIIAQDFGISEKIIGLTLVAIGTSLPELATTVMAAIRKQAEVAIGNIIGSNMFNLLAIIGITALIAPVDVDQSFLTFDLWVMLISSLILIPFIFFKKDIGMRAGLVLVSAYLAYLAITVIG